MGKEAFSSCCNANDTLSSSSGASWVSDGGMQHNLCWISDCAGFWPSVMCENCNYSVSYVEGRRGQYNLKIISAWHHCIVYSFNNGFVNHAKIYPGLVWMVCYGAVLVAGLRLDSIGEPSCTGNPTGPVRPWAGSERTSMSADNDVDRLRRLHHRSTEIQRRSLNQAWEFFPPHMNQCDKERANKTQSSQFMLFSVL